jgi:hypothetical protein
VIERQEAGAACVALCTLEQRPSHTGSLPHGINRDVVDDKPVVIDVDDAQPDDGRRHPGPTVTCRSRTTCT